MTTSAAAAGTAGAFQEGMKIVCGTDFSVPSFHATEVAAGLAQRFGDSLDLVHVVELSPLVPPEVLSSTLARGLDDVARRNLASVSQDLHRRGIDIAPHVVFGAPAESLTAHAREIGARMLVLGTRGRGAAARFFVGSVAERVVRSAACPVLVVPEAPIGAIRPDGAAAPSPLRIVAGVDLSPASDAVAAWLTGIADAIPCAITFVHVYWPPREQARLGLAPRIGREAGAEVVEVLERELRRRLGPVAERPGVRLRIFPTLGVELDPLVAASEAEGADLLVVGTHVRKGLARGSTAVASLRASRVPVLCIPAPGVEARPDVTDLPPVERVLVPTDLTELGNEAVPLAYRLLRAGGVVELVHVVEGSGAGAAERTAAAERRLRGLEPAGAAARGTVTRVSVIDSANPREAIVQAADRLGVDLIVMASHGRSALGRAVLGSVADGVVRTASRPVLLVRPRG